MTEPTAEQVFAYTLGWKGEVAPEQLRAWGEAYAAAPKDRYAGFAAFLKAQGFVTAQKWEALQSWFPLAKRRMQETPFAQAAVEAEYCSAAQIDTAMAVQEQRFLAQATPVALDDILVEQGVLREEQVLSLMMFSDDDEATPRTDAGEGNGTVILSADTFAHAAASATAPPDAQPADSSAKATAGKSPPRAGEDGNATTYIAPGDLGWTAAEVAAKAAELHGQAGDAAPSSGAGAESTSSSRVIDRFLGVDDHDPANCTALGVVDLQAHDWSEYDAPPIWLDVPPLPVEDDGSITHMAAAPVEHEAHARSLIEAFSPAAETSETDPTGVDIPVFDAADPDRDPIREAVEALPEQDPNTDAGVPFGKKYRLFRVLGRKTLGVVYLARHQGLGRLVAMRILTPLESADEALAAETLQSANAAGRFSHPNIVGVYETGWLQSRVFVAHEFLEARPLGLKLKADGPFDSRQAAELIAQLMEPMQLAREQTFGHGLPRLNTMRLCAGSLLKLQHFGQPLPGDPPTPGQPFGPALKTPRYAPPETILGASTDERSHQYALGVCYYALVTGRYPFRGTSHKEILQAHLRGFPTPPSQVNPRIPVTTDRIILRMLAGQPLHRYPNWEALAVDLAEEAKRIIYRPDVVRCHTCQALNAPGTTACDICGTVIGDGTVASAGKDLVRDTGTRVQAPPRVVMAPPPPRSPLAAPPPQVTVEKDEWGRKRTVPKAKTSPVESPPPPLAPPPPALAPPPPSLSPAGESDDVMPVPEPEPEMLPSGEAPLELDFVPLDDEDSAEPNAGGTSRQQAGNTPLRRPRRRR